MDKKIFYNIIKKSGKPLVLALILVILGTSFLIGCEAKKEKTLADKLYSYKTKYVGDNSKVGGIVSNLEFPKEYGYKSMEILSKEEPYGLKLYFDGNTNEADIDDFKYDSAILFSLVDNLDYITFIIEENGEEMEIGTLTRDNIDSMTTSILGMKTSELGSSKNKFTKLVEFYKEIESEIKEDKDDTSQIIEYNLNVLAKKNSEADSKNYKNQNEYGDIVKLGEVGLEYILSEFENGNVQDDLKGQIMKDFAIEILGPKNNVENYRELSPTEWYKRLDIIDIVKIEDDSQVFEDKYEELVYKAHYPTKYKKEEDSFTAIALDVKGIYEKDNIIKIYAIVSKNLVVLYDDGKVIDDSGYLMPTVTVYEKKGDAYELIDVIQPRDGSEYAPSIREMCKDKPMMAIKLMNIDHEKINEELRNNVITILKKNGHNNVNMEGF